ncbi:carbohydrate ABC transporter permease [Chloroflexus sp.]|uniref:carbohydrate ABC transporter permease n=1 Tax=Chloroflexus sp. TaxID=1904827 RepID=UPI0029F83B30|nr:carbohydrate ABC transporter permease [Chloroflexus sp.]MCS6886885.1 carbohydrate ABC transporter permease [Chloroflexus sp.]MCX7858753.1 carbohydrate ABC transporter permease [Chloroflexus sp.]
MRRLQFDYLRRVVWGVHNRPGLLPTSLLYAILIAIGFVYLYPLLFMAVNSFKSPADLLNPMVQWVPTELYLGNYQKAYRVLNYLDTLRATIVVSAAPTVLQVVVCALVGYGLARYRLWGKPLLFALIFATFVIPPQNTIIPQMLNYRYLNLLGNIWALLIPAALGQGFKSAIFILIFYQNFLSLPRALEEAARLDGASDLGIFWRIALPGAVPAFIVSFIFSVVWYWNETYLTTVFLEGGIQTLPMQLAKFTQAYENLYPSSMVNIFDRLNEAVKMSGTFLTILPLLVIYFILQRWFVESIERSGLAGE